MPPSVNRLLLTSLHSLIILAMLSSSLVPLAAIAAPSAVLIAPEISQDASPVDTIPESITPTPEAENAVIPDILTEPIPWVGPLSNGNVPIIPTAIPGRLQVPIQETVPSPLIEIPESDNPVDSEMAIPEFPEDILGSYAPENSDAFPESPVIPMLPQAPVAVTVELDRYLLAQGDQAILTIRAGREDNHFEDGAVLTLSLPPQLRIVGDEETTKVWSYDAEAIAARIHQTFTVQVDPSLLGTLPVVADIWLAASVENYSPRRSQWSVGITGATVPGDGSAQRQAVQTASGTVLNAAGMTLLMPASAAPTNVQIEYTPLYTATEQTSEVAASEEISVSAAFTDGQQLRLPTIRQDNSLMIASNAALGEGSAEKGEDASALIPMREDNGVALYRLWHLSADGLQTDNVESNQADAEHPRFDAPVMMVVDVADLVAAGVDMSQVNLWTRPDSTYMWTPVRFARYDSERQVMVATLYHFSDFGLGIAPSQAGEFLPSMNGFSSDRHTGSVSVNYPIVTPAGLGGLQPNLSLSYSSDAANDIQFAVEPEGEEPDRHIQASVVGYGWNLSGLNYITMFRDGDDPNVANDLSTGLSYSLVLNGKSYDIFENDDVPGTYETNPYSFAAITNNFTASESTWQIKTPDGVLYEFGGTLPDLEWDNTEAERHLHVEMRSTIDGITRTLEVVSWYLRRVEDTAGNTMEYSYLVQRNPITDNCVPNTFQYDGQEDQYALSTDAWYNRATYLTDVTWGSNTGKYGASKAPTLRVHLEYDGRSDYDNGEFKIKDGCQPRKTNKRLEAIYVEAAKTDSSGWHRLRSYNLDSSYAITGTHDETGEDAYLRHMLLDEIHEYGVTTTTASLFNIYSFTYIAKTQADGDTENRIFLETADNGFGSKTTYTYGSSRAKCPADHHADACAPSNIRYFVTRTDTNDGQGTHYIIDHSYTVSPTVVIYGGKSYNFGFKTARNKIYAPTTVPSGTLAESRYEEYGFYQFDDVNPDIPDTRHGRLKEFKVYDKSSTGKKQFSQTNYVWRSQLWNGNVFTNSTWLNDRAHWIWLEREDEWTGGAGTVGAGLQKRYFYDLSAQEGEQFGNLTRVEEYSHPEDTISLSTWQTRVNGNTLALQRRTKTTFYPNTGWLADPDDPYIIDRPAQTIVENSSGGCQAETHTVYASNLSSSGVQNRDGRHTVEPATAYVIKTEQVISGCPYQSPSTPTDNREDSNLLVTTYARDVYGNEIARSSHNGSGDTITINTSYDSFYHLFPVERWNNGDPSLVASAKYYGVDSVAVDNDYGSWGAMSETCEVNDICTRFGYDEHGRKTRQWDRQLLGSSWPTEPEANVVWGYRKPGELNPAQTAYIVTEWHSPRCEGNWVRHHYNGLGQLVVEQKSYQDYDLDDNGAESCLPGDTIASVSGHEFVTYFIYNAFGLFLQSIPQLKESDGSGGYLYYAPVPDFSTTPQLTAYDPLGRVVTTASSNSAIIYTVYVGRTLTVYSTSTTNQADFKKLRSQVFDALGNLKYVKNERWNGASYTVDAQIELTHDVIGNLISVKQPSTMGTSTYTFDQAGRMTSLNDLDLGAWIYTYNRHGQLTQQKDARNISTCLYYDISGRLEVKHYTGVNESCPTTPATSYHEKFTYGTSGSEAGQLTDIQLRQIGTYTSIYTKTVDYTSVGQMDTETIQRLGWATTTSGYGYDPYGRVQELTYPDGEEVSYGFNGMGLHESIESNTEGIIADGIGYDVLGRIGSMRLPSVPITNSLYLTNTYYEWDGVGYNGDARLKAIEARNHVDPDAKLLLEYRYDMYGNIQELDEDYSGVNEVTNSFEYDAYNRLTEANYISPTTITHHYAFTTTGRPQIYAGQEYAYTVKPIHSVNKAKRLSDSQQLVFTYDADGNMTQRQYFDASGVKQTQNLYWDQANRLGAVTLSGPTSPTYFAYDADGGRVIQQKGVSGSLVANFYPSPLWEVEYAQPANTMIPTRYYLLNGQPIALRIGNQPVTHLYRDQVGSVVMTSQNGVITDTRQYYAYGSKRGGDNYPFDANYTGQRLDDTGLLYYNARYYDPQLGMFISPDSMIPDPTDFFSYNRYLYSKGNPLKYNDPSGHCATNDDGSRSSEDATCWSRADETVGSWAVDPQWWGGSDMTAQDWLTYVATKDYATTEFIEGRLYDFWSPKYLASNVFHERYNPPPVWNEPHPHPIETLVDIMDCSHIDCVAVGLDVIAVGGGFVAIAASPACTVGIFACAALGANISTGATAMGGTLTLINRAQGNASERDVAINTITVVTNLGGPGWGFAGGIIQTIYDLWISPNDGVD